MQIRFVVSSVKYPPIPVEQKEDGKPFAPMQINVCVLVCLYTHAQFTYVLDRSYMTNMTSISKLVSNSAHSVWQIVTTLSQITIVFIHFITSYNIC
jgi:hypothetical protein